MKTKKILYVLIVIVILVLGYALYKKFYNPKSDNNQLTDKQVASLMKKVSKLIIVPDEKPVVATILDANALSAEQDFYKGSQNGDRLFVFPTAKRALIYREKTNQLVNVGPIIIDPNQNKQQAPSAPASTTEETSTTTSKLQKGN